MIDYIFYYENEIYTIYQRTHFSNVFVYNKGKKLRQHVEQDFFVKILKASISDVDMLFAFPWKMDLVEDKFMNPYLEKYKAYWNNKL